MLLIANQDKRILNYSICDVSGKILQSDKLSTGNELLHKETIDTRALSSGCYFITLQGTNINETKKIIIQK